MQARKIKETRGRMMEEEDVRQCVERKSERSV